MLEVNTIAVIGLHEAVVEYSWVTLITLYWSLSSPTTPLGNMTEVLLPPISTTSIWKFLPSEASPLEYPTYLAGNELNKANNGALKYSFTKLCEPTLKLSN